LEYPYNGVLEAIISPLQDVYKNQPVLPKVTVRNTGAFAISEVPVDVIIRKNGVVVYEVTEYVPYLAEKDEIEGQDVVDYEFTTAFIPTETGRYDITAIISKEDDSDTTDNTRTAVFDVLGSLSGSITVGKNSTYKTIKEALNAVYTRGIDGTITFVLSDPVMELGDISSEYALDFSSSISGFNTSTNKIRFVPSKALSRMEGGVTLRLSSKSGIGIRFGSTVHSSEFPSAPVNRVQFLAKRDYYPFNAVVEFDGGSNRSIHFTIGDMPSDQPTRILLYFAEGASNISIKNCLLSNAIGSNAMNLPLVLWNREKNEFTYDGISNLSTSILLRSIPPMDEFGLNRTYNLDTLMNRNIVIENNKIENGAYGIVSIGIGALYNASKGQFERYYNHNNHIANNTITSQTRAGIYFGYEENSRILNNRIHFIGYALQDSDSSDIAGIILGGEGKQFGYDKTIDEARFERFGYNNINVKIDGNEVSRIVSNNNVYGIKIEQERNNFYDMHILHGKHPFMPNVDDSIKVYNNLVWNLISKNIHGSKYGIRLFTTRDNKSDNYLHNFAIQKELGYNILSSSIINNSVIIDDDGIDNSDQACIAGVVIQNVDKFRMFNNAINLLDKDAKSDVVAPVVLESVRPEYIDIDMDNNLYYSDDKEQAIARYIELSRIDNRVDLDLLGYRNEYVSIDQWQLLTNGEASTTTYNFISNLDTIKRGVIPFIRIKSPVPIGSYLNNRGKVVPEVVCDIDGNLRGVADQGYDIGAWEFDGQLYDDDLGFLAFVEPVAYKDNRETSPFSDAEYVMTTSPVNVRVNIRNNGSVFAENKPIVLTIYNTETNQEVLKVTQDFTIGAFEIKTLDFQTNNKKLTDRLFNPVPYGFDNPNTPSRFATMANNVTPIYKLVVELPVDEDLTNNTNRIEKLVRFYIKKSSLHLLISAENTTLVDNKVADYYKYIDEKIEVDAAGKKLSEIAGFANYKALRNAFEKLGYSLQQNDATGKTIKDGFDILDRTNWEPHSVNYTPYHSIFWSDGLNDRFTEEQENAVNKFLALSSIAIKRNLVISSEELARTSYAIYTAAELEDYFYKLFNTQPKDDGIYESNFDANGLDWLSGSMLAPNLETSFRNTLLVGSGKDVHLQAGIFEHLEQAGLNTRVVGQAYYYKHPTFVHRNLKSMGVVSYSLKDFLIYLGLDWRHYSSPEFILSSIIDFINNNAGSIVPVQLLSFDAFAGSYKVYSNWETASEFNSDKFVVERSTLTNAGKSNFDIIAEVKASGTTSVGQDYSMVDNGVAYGNTYAYRLKFVDLDGSYSYSDEKLVTIDEGSQLISFEKIAPNPVKDILTINFSLSSEADVRISLIEVSGKVDAVINEGRFDSNLHSLKFDVSNIATGTYTVLINTNNSSMIQTINIVK
ncbi:MAG TPA: T9SS type A sorting domain-containing protein, partial [Clostridiales bacterium]|nr:T9SS type A sorting domain-containing protein [Clostridiales bacterium]